MNTTKTRGTIIRRELLSEGGNEYEYTLSMRESEMTASYCLPLYSVGVKMRRSDGELSEATIEDAFRSAEAAFRFFNLIVENVATPIDLPFVFEDESLR